MKEKINVIAWLYAIASWLNLFSCVTTAAKREYFLSAIYAFLFVVWMVLAVLYLWHEET